MSGTAPNEISSPAFAASSAPATPIAYDVAAIVALSLAVCMFHLGSFGLWEPDEARYAEIAREMLQSGSLLVPHLNYVAYVEKPPLLYWLTTLSFWIFGVSEFAARIPVAMSAIAGVLATYVFALRAFGRRHAILAAAILATTPLYALMAQVLTTDMTLTALVTIATFSFYLHWHEGGRWCWIAYVAMGLAVMTKGPVGAALPILSMLIWLALKRELRGAIAKFRVVPGLMLTTLIAAPWFVMMSIREPGFADFYFVGEHLRRFFETDYSHSEAFYFYVPVLAIGLLPWTLLVPFLTWREAPRNPARSLCLVAASVTLVAFSCANAKLIPYILPAVPPLAVLIADGLVACAWPATDSRAARRPPDSRILIESGPMLALLGAGVIVAAIAAPQFRTPYVMTARPCVVCDRRDPDNRRRSHDVDVHHAPHGCGARFDRRHARVCIDRRRMGAAGDRADAFIRGVEPCDRREGARRGYHLLPSLRSVAAVLQSQARRAARRAHRTRLRLATRPGRAHLVHEQRRSDVPAMGPAGADRGSARRRRSRANEGELW